ncbi:unnamed protein product [Clonostachys rosea f. rosea IK726]|uniref:Uncharacterized protein n=3 Tax=Clonostachys rosea f. rosea IK726 TaxID=1349383 RepID=A0ACA9UY80_BIOOC|nr:unnamed protein product [Clonostachys rosea f. rosea IK726]CAG9957249.1 unnamed protein product [Clonostachys rosea f. rosea IK726]CAG9957252.1 unnamed protein product [Clonostachys rosea f. rosea IK726]
MPGGIEIHTKGTLSKATPRKGASAKKASGQGYCKCFTRDNSEIDDDFKKEEGLPEYTGYDYKILGISWLRYDE